MASSMGSWINSLKMHNSLNTPSILDQFNPEVLGVFWLTRDELNRDLIGFDELNYLFDGLISQYLYGLTEKKAEHAHIFFSENFKARIFLAHLKTKDITKSQIASEIDEHLALIPPSENHRKKILVFDKTEHNWINELKKRYPQYDFLPLNYVLNT